MQEMTHADTFAVPRPFLHRRHVALGAEPGHAASRSRAQLARSAGAHHRRLYGRASDGGGAQRGQGPQSRPPAASARPVTANAALTSLHLEPLNERRLTMIHPSLFL